jgi:hypothetical protein
MGGDRCTKLPGGGERCTKPPEAGEVWIKLPDCRSVGERVGGGDARKLSCDLQQQNVQANACARACEK